MSNKNSASKALKEYLRKNGTITTLEAFKKLGITRLSAYIFILRNNGWIISSTPATAKTRYGKTTKYSIYYVSKEGE